MKTAISLPDDLFERGERLAKRLGISRSELYRRALASFVTDHEGEALTAELDSLYEEEAADSQLDPVIEAMQGASLVCDRNEDEW